MDFKEIKNIWNDSFNKKEQLNGEQIEAMLKIKSRSNNVLRKLRKSYRFDIYFGSFIFILLIIGMGLYIHSSYKIHIISFTALFFTMIIWFTWASFNKIRKTTILNDQIKSALLKTIKDLEKFVVISRSSIAKFIIIPFSIVLGVFIGFVYAASVKNIEITEMILSLKTGSIIIIIVLLVFETVIIIPLLLYVNKKLYKDKLDELKECLKEFEENANN